MKRTTTYNWKVIQTGTIILKPDGKMLAGEEHTCTSVAIWPEGEDPAPDNTLLTDPAFTERSFPAALKAFDALGIELGAIKNIFITHPHADHTPTPLLYRFIPAANVFTVSTNGNFPGMAAVECPGHHTELRSLVFQDVQHRRIWVAGDAVLDLEWLLVWRYFWPNNYTQEEITQTWHTIARIIAEADVIIPGHGAPIETTAPLVRRLIAAFPEAELAGQCPTVIDTLQTRLEELSSSHQQENNFGTTDG